VVRSIDLAPTILSLLGLPVPEEFTGRPLPLVDGHFEPDGDRPVFMETRRFSDLRGVVLGDHKLIRNERSGAVRVFDLAADPQERSPLSGGEEEARLLKLLDEHYAQSETIVPERELEPEELDALRELGYIE
jgi:arylsulfatase A-like enzyme